MISDFLIFFSVFSILEPEGFSQQSLCESGDVKGEVAIDGRPGLCAFSFQLLTTWSLHLSLQATSGFHAATL